MKTLLNHGIAILGGLAIGMLLKGASVDRETAASATSPPTESPAPRTTPRERKSTLVDVEACRKQMEEASRADGRHPLLRRVAYEEALRRWIELDPNGAWTEAQTNPKGRLAREMMLAWVELDPQRATEMLEKSSRVLVGAVSRDFFRALMAKDPALAASVLKDPWWDSEKQSFLGINFRNEVYRQWMLSDPEAARAEFGDVLKKHPSEDGAPGRAALVDAAAELDFAGEWKRATASGCTMDLRAILGIGLRNGEPAALEALKGWLENGAEKSRDEKWANLADKVASGDPARALALAGQIQGHEDFVAALRRAVARSTVESDPIAALDLMKSTESIEASWQDGYCVRAAFGELGFQDPALATSRLAELPSGLQLDAMRGLFDSVFSKAPEEGVALFEEWKQDPRFAEIVADNPEKFLSGSTSEIQDILKAIPELNDAVSEDTMLGWTGNHTEAAAEWVANRVAAGKPFDFGYAGHEFMKYFPDLPTSYTTGWLERIGDPELQARGAVAVMNRWLVDDPEAARAWVDGLPEGTLREAARKALEHGADDASH